MTLRRTIRAIARNRRAVAAIEFALVAPALMLMAGGTTELGLLLRVYAATNRLATQYAISYADCADTSAGVCQTEAARYATTAALGNIAPQLAPAQLTLTIIEARMNGATPTVIYAYPTNATPTAVQTAALQAAVPSGLLGVVVTASYTQTLQFFPGLMAPIIGSALQFSYTSAQLK